jgi:Uma2 family endonuclease
MANTAIKLMSVEEFLAWDDGTDTRYELFDGQPVAMAPPVVRHSVLAGRLGRAIGNAVAGRTGCEVFPEVGIRSNSSPRTFFVADIAVSCEDRLDRSGELHRPVLIVEILSPSTEKIDRKRKLREYRLLPSVQEILLIDGADMFCEVHRRTGDMWRTDLLGGSDARLRLESIGLDVSLGELYAGIVLDEPSAGVPPAFPEGRDRV